MAKASPCSKNKVQTRRIRPCAMTKDRVNFCNRLNDIITKGQQWQDNKNILQQ